jgi:hypothetical protein
MYSGLGSITSIGPAGKAVRAVRAATLEMAAPAAWPMMRSGAWTAATPVG